MVLPVNVNHSADAEGRPIMLGATVHLPHDVIHDPLPDYMEWFGCKLWMTITDVVMRERFWSQRDLRDWIDANIYEPVLVQRNSNSSEWKLCFCTPEEHKRFGMWFYGAGKYTFRFTKGNEALFNEIKKWMEENLTRDGFETSRGYSSSYGSGQISFTMRVKDKTEAAAFKLRWHGVEAEIE